ncbi:MAG: pyridoxal phosphate-dependent aminotransferase [Acidobacteriota bacterium]
MVLARAPYMEWAKSRPHPRVDLAGSNLLACAIEDLPGAREALDLSGESPDGYPPLLDAIAARYGVGPENVATAGGCSGANFLACAALLQAGDEVVVERPVYDPLVAAVRMLGARPRFFDRRPEEGFAIDLRSVEKALTASTRLVIVSNPHNPSGVLAASEEIEGLARLAERAGVLVLADEVYRDAVAGPALPPAARSSAAFVSSSSLTKAYGLSSLRCGWTLASPEITRRIRRARDVVDVSGAIPAERLSALAFHHLDRLAERARLILEPNRRLFLELLARRPELECAPFRAPIAFPRFRDGRDAGAFARRLFERHAVAVVPGSFFDLPSHFRVSLGGSPPAVAAGLEALERCLAEA